MFFFKIPDLNSKKLTNQTLKTEYFHYIFAS